MTFTTEQLDKMVWDAHIASHAVIGEGVLADVCCHVRALAAEVERLQQMACLEKERCMELEAIVDRLPKTADGLPVVPGDEVWSEKGRRFCVVSTYSISSEGFQRMTNELYSTREAARESE